MKKTKTAGASAPIRPVLLSTSGDTAVVQVNSISPWIYKSGKPTTVTADKTQGVSGDIINYGLTSAAVAGDFSLVYALQSDASKTKTLVIHVLDFPAAGYDFTYTEANGEVTITGIDTYPPSGTITDMVIPETYGNNNYPVTKIGNNAFYNNEALLGSVTIPDSVEEIGVGAFGTCGGLTSVNLGTSVKMIGYGAFNGCISLTGTLTIPNSVVTIGGLAFGYCAGLTSVNLGNSVTTIGVEAFEHCIGLTSITIPNSVRTLNGFSYCTGLTSVTIPEGVVTIGSFAFGNCDGLTSVTIPNSVTSIEQYAFEDCISLTSVNIPNFVIELADDTFAGCTGLTSVILGLSVTLIGQHCFLNCTSLASFKLTRTSALPNQGYYYTPFTNVPIASATLYVPTQALKTAAQNTFPWSGFGTIAIG